MNKLQTIKDRAVVQIDLQKKNSHTFKDGTKIRLERRFDNFNLRFVNPVNAIVIDAEDIPEGTEILIHHNSIDKAYEILNYKQVSGTDIASDIRYFSIPTSFCFAWFDENKEWQPMKGFDFALRVFKPYTGMLHGLEPTLIKDTLYVTTGEYKGKVFATLKACDYEIIFQDTNGREGNLIRFRSSENEKEQREMEIVAIHNDLTKQLLKGQLLVGVTKSDAKPIKDIKEHERCN